MIETGDLCPFCMQPGCASDITCPQRADDGRRVRARESGRRHSGRFIAASNEHASSSDICNSGIQPCATDCPMFDCCRWLNHSPIAVSA
jgi:hypothetical protein